MQKFGATVDVLEGDLFIAYCLQLAGVFPSDTRDL